MIEGMQPSAKPRRGRATPLVTGVAAAAVLALALAGSSTRPSAPQPLAAKAKPPGKVRVDIKGRSEDFVASLHDGGAELPTGTQVLIVEEGERGSLLVAKGEM